MFSHLRANLWLLVLTLILCTRVLPAHALGGRKDVLPAPGGREPDR